MRLKKRKILLWVAVALLGLSALFAFITLFQANQASVRAGEFIRRNAEAPARAAQIAVRLGEASHPVRSSSLVSSAPAQTTSSLRREIAETSKEFSNLLDDAFETKRWFSRHNWHTGSGGIVLFLPAEGFHDEGASGPPRGGAALLDRIHAEVRANDQWGYGLAPPEEQKTPVTSASLAARAAALFDRQRDLLRAGCTDAELALLLSEPWCWSQAPFVILREARQGRKAEAGALLERLVRIKLHHRVQRFPLLMSWIEIQRLALRLAEDGLTDDAVLACIDRLFKASRLSEAQLKDLRAAAAIKTIQEAEKELERMGPSQKDAYSHLVRDVSRMGARVVLEPLYDATIAWASGDGDAYDRALRNPLAVTFVIPKILAGDFCPPNQAAFGGESAANDSLDMTRLIVAAARYRLALGRYPARFEELVPKYLDAGFQRGALSLRMVDALTVSPEPGRPATQWPLFIQVRRFPLTAVRLMGSWGYGAHYSRLDRTDLLPSSGSGGLLRHLGIPGVDMLKIMSDRSIDAFLIQVVWPRLEGEAFLQTLGIPGPPSHQ